MIKSEDEFPEDYDVSNIRKRHNVNTKPKLLLPEDPHHIHFTPAQNIPKRGASVYKGMHTVMLNI